MHYKLMILIMGFSFGNSFTGFSAQSQFNCSSYMAPNEYFSIYDPKISFNTLFKKYYNTMTLYANRFLHDRQSARDVTIDNFLKLSQTDTFFEEKKARAFLYVSIHNACLNLVGQRKRRIKKEKAYLSEQTTIFESPDKNIVRAEFFREIFNVLESLPPQCRNIMNLKYHHGLRNQEIADHLNISKNTVRNQIQRGLNLIRQRLPDLDSSDGFL